MKNKLFRNKIEVKKSSIQGYGVFATCDIKKDDLIEECYVIVYNQLIPEFYNYAFSPTEDPDETRSVLALGYGSLYNHSNAPNATHWVDVDNQLIVFKARKKIQAGEEILVSYGKEWFSDRKIKILPPKPQPKVIYKVLLGLIKLLFIVFIMLLFKLIPNPFFNT